MTETMTAADSALKQFALLESSGQLTIIPLAASIGGADDNEPQNQQSGGRTSDASSYADESSTPASLAADLEHYKELFSKLRFSYIEQVTKEKFLRAITAETPLFIEASDNIALEAQLAEEKTALKKQKEEVASLTKELEKKGRELAKRYQVLQEQKETLQGLPSKLASLQADIEELHSLYPSPHKNENPDLNLPLADTLSLLSERQSSLADVDAEIAALQEELPTKIRELERLDDELSGLSQQKKMAVSRAREARERKEAGGMDEVERRGRWLRTGDSLLRDMMDVDG